MKTVKYVGNLPEVIVGLSTGDLLVKKSEPFQVTDEEFLNMANSQIYQEVKTTFIKKRGEI